MPPSLGLLLCLLLAPPAPRTLTAAAGNLEGEWRFHTDPADVGENEGWQKPEFDDSAWRSIDVPGSWEPQGVTDSRPGQPPKPRDGVPWTDYDGVAWYRLRVVVPREWEGQELLLRLGSVDDQDRTFVNGRLIGATGPGVNNPVTVQRVYPVPGDAVRFGEENVIAVRVLDGGGPGGFDGPLVTFTPKQEIVMDHPLPQGDRPLAERFADPPAGNRILKIIHGWPDDANGQDLLISQLRAQGFGGVVCNVSFTDYLQSEERWQAFVRAVGQAKQQGFAMWLYDERGYPSGAAGGLTLKDHPEWEARGLLIADTSTIGGAVSLQAPPGRLVLAAAWPVRDGRLDTAAAVDLTGSVQDGKLAWTAPASAWRVMLITEDRLYEGTHASMSLGDKLPYINLLMPEPTHRFLELTHAEYARRLGPELSRDFISTFTDEPSLMSLFMRPQPYRALPWAPNLPVEFARRRGYALEPHLAELVAPAAGGARVRHDYWLTVGELVSETFFGQIQTWCGEHGLASGGHLLAEEDVAADVALYGDFFRCMRRLDAPSIDCLTSAPSDVPWQVARLCGSAADLEGRAQTMCETSDFSQVYRPQGDSRPVRVVTEEEIRGTVNRLMLGGIHTITSYYTFNKLTTQQLQRLNQYVGRCSTLLSGGHQVTDVAVVYPAESFWPHYEPLRGWRSDVPEVGRTAAAYNAVVWSLYRARRDPAIVAGSDLAEASVDGGSLRRGELRWPVVVLPGVDTLPAAAWANLRKLWQSGGVVVAMGARPANTDREFPSAGVQDMARELFGDGDEPHVNVHPDGGVAAWLPEGAEGQLGTLLEAVLTPDVACGAGGPLRAAHRRVDGHDVWLLINDSGAAHDDTVTLAAAGAGELYRPTTGEVQPVAGAEGIALHVEPYEGVLLRFESDRARKRLAVKSGALPGLRLESLPGLTAGAGGGEFVRREFGPDPDHATAEQPAWRAVGTLTKGQVDTHLFVSFSAAKPLDLRGADSLVIDTWVPDGQKTPAELLVIVREAGGGDFLASTGRAMSRAGRVRVYLPLDRLALAGWSKDADGVLDPGRVEAISVGWGGYFGTEGEEVAFSVAAPLLGRREGAAGR
ncbi:MAG: hypothetical protein HYU66_11145 [Armatimonadetes bacterium]|nr:hypothetical protein [Armatimonadota bacterium]